MTNRELIELAALAAGIEGEWQTCMGEVFLIPVEDELFHAGIAWNPLTNKHQAFELMVKLQASVSYWSNLTSGERVVCVSIQCPGWDEPIDQHSEEEELGDDPEAATCLAITRCAAEVGKLIKEANDAKAK